MRRQRYKVKPNKKNERLDRVIKAVVSVGLFTCLSVLLVHLLITDTVLYD